MRLRMKTNLLISGIAIFCGIYYADASVALGAAAEPPKAAWQAEWEKTVRAAEQEGQLTLDSEGGRFLCAY